MKYFSLLLLIVLCVFQFQIWQPHSGLLQQYADIQKEAQAVQQENKLLRHRNQMLAAEVDDLKEGFDTTAEIARSELGFIEKGEILYNENIYALIASPRPQNTPDKSPAETPSLSFINIYILLPILHSS